MNQAENNQLVNAEQLLELLFDKKSRPTTRWLRRLQKQRVVPHIKIGRLVRFNPDRVREALERKCTISARA